MKNKNGLFIQALLCAFLLICFLYITNVKNNASVKTSAFGRNDDSHANYTFSQLAKKLGEKF